MTLTLIVLLCRVQTLSESAIEWVRGWLSDWLWLEGGADSLNPWCGHRRRNPWLTTWGVSWVTAWIEAWVDWLRELSAWIPDWLCEAWVEWLCEALIGWVRGWLVWVASGSWRQSVEESQETQRRQWVECVTTDERGGDDESLERDWGMREGSGYVGWWVMREKGLGLGNLGFRN
jgi:hypothetical protein